MTEAQQAESHNKKYMVQVTQAVPQQFDKPKQDSGLALALKTMAHLLEELIVFLQRVTKISYAFCQVFSFTFCNLLLSHDKRCHLYIYFTSLHILLSFYTLHILLYFTSLHMLLFSLIFRATFF